MQNDLPPMCDIKKHSKETAPRQQTKNWSLIGSRSLVGICEADRTALRWEDRRHWDNGGGKLTL